MLNALIFVHDFKGIPAPILVLGKILWIGYKLYPGDIVNTF